MRLEKVEAVLARCGKPQRLLVRVAPTASQVDGNETVLTGTGGAARAPNDSTVPAVNSTSLNASTRRASASSEAGSVGDRLNVLVLFIDSLSRRHLFRRLPRTTQALEALASGKYGRAAEFIILLAALLSCRRPVPRSLMATLSVPLSTGGASQVHQFFRHHVVGLNTATNTHPLVTGTKLGHWGAAMPNRRPAHGLTLYARLHFLLTTPCKTAKNLSAAVDPLRAAGCWQCRSAAGLGLVPPCGLHHWPGKLILSV